MRVNCVPGHADVVSPPSLYVISAGVGVRDRAVRALNRDWEVRRKYLLLPFLSFLPFLLFLFFLFYLGE